MFMQVSFGLKILFAGMSGLSNLFSNSTLAEGLGLVSGLATIALDDPDLNAMKAELQALKSEVEQATGGLSDAMWDGVEDDDLRFMFQVQAGQGRD